MGVHDCSSKNQFVKGVAFINGTKQDEVLTGLGNTASSCLITPTYFQLYIQLAAFPLCTWGLSSEQNCQALLEAPAAAHHHPTVDWTDRIRLPSVIPWRWLCTALSCRPYCEWLAALTAFPFSTQRFCSHTHSGPHVHKGLLAVRRTA